MSIAPAAAGLEANRLDRLRSLERRLSVSMLVFMNTSPWDRQVGQPLRPVNRAQNATLVAATSGDIRMIAFPPRPSYRANPISFNLRSNLLLQAGFDPSGNLGGSEKLLSITRVVSVEIPVATRGSFLW